METILRPGQIVGANYRVDRLIAEGGMATVWAGVNQHTGKRVALKVILRSFASNGEAVELFRREALAASKVNHPNVVNIFDVIDHEGMTCIVMELFDGETLGSYLARNGPLSLGTTLALLLPAMRGVAAANAQGVVHRDLKPANIFLCSSPGGQLITTKVLDFGISVMMRRVGETVPVTEPLAMFGTPAYMAPEAIEFSPDIDGRADVYGFGVLFFEALTGKLPFPGKPGLELLERILTEPAPMVTLYRSDLPPDVVDLIARALAKAPKDRFANMEHLIHATEDRLLPLLQTPRSLTPLSGIHLLPPAESNAGVQVPMVQALFEKEPSSLLHLLHLGETRALYSLESEPSQASGGAKLAPRELLPAKTAARPPRKRLSIPWRFRNRRAAIDAAIIVFVVVTAWVAVPASSSDSGVRQPQSSRTPEISAPTRGPLVTPLPSLPSPAPSPAIVADDPSDSVAEGKSVPVDEQPVPTPPTTLSAAPHPSRHVSHEVSPTRWRRTADSPDLPAAPRAGRLSATDF
jgi:serine/threonine-protein kinase